MLPEHNPFPAQAVTTIEGLDWTEFLAQPTLVRPTMRQILSSIQSYTEDVSSDPLTRTGRALAIYGAHGTGKTHALVYALARLGTGGDGAARLPVILYGRADGASEIALYRKLTSRLTFKDLQVLNSQAFAGYASEAVDKTRSLSDEDHRVIHQRLHESPEIVDMAVAAGEISLSSVIDAQERDLERVQGRVENFHRILQALQTTNPKMSQDAYRWMVGQDLEVSKLLQLGVESNLFAADDVRTAIHVLGAVARQAGRPFFVAIDQAESFLTDQEGRLSREAAGFMRAVLEAVVREGGFFIASMNEDAWTGIPRDLRQRFGPTQIRLLRLTTREATDLLGAYLPPAKGAVDAFTPAAVEQLLIVSGGNTRKLLQTCFVIYRWAVKSKSAEITEHVVNKALDATTTMFVTPTRHEVTEWIVEILRQGARNFRREWVVGGKAFDFVVEIGEWRLLIEIINPVFGEADASPVLRALELMSGADRQNTVTLFVVVGYSSPDAISLVENAADQIVTVDSRESFGDLARVIQSKLDSGGAGSNTATSASQRDLSRVRDEVSRLVERQQESRRNLSVRLESLSNVHAAAALPDMLNDFRRTWLPERQRIYDDLVKERLEQQQRDFAELSSLHSEYVARERAIAFRRRFSVTVILVGLTLSTVLLAFFVSDSSNVALISSAAALGALTVSFLSSLWSVADNRKPEYGGIASREELDRIARLVLGKSRRTGGLTVTDADPYLRYAALIGGEGIGGHSTIVEALRTEPSRLLRVEMARVLAHDGGAVSPQEIEKLQRILDPDALTALLEMVALRRRADREDSEEPIYFDHPQVVHLAAFYGFKVDQHGWLDDFLGSIRGDISFRNSKRSSDRQVDQLVHAYHSDDDHVLLEVISMWPERILRGAANELGPGSSGSLAGCYWLKAISELDEVYLFLRKAGLLAALGIAR